MRRFLASAVVLVGLAAPLCLMAQPRGAPHSFAHSTASYRSFASAPRTPVPPRSFRSAPRSNSIGNSGISPSTGTSLINFGQSACLLNPSYSGSSFCRQYYPGGTSLGFEPVYPYWMPSIGSQTEEPAPPAAEPEQDPQLAAQVGNLAAEVEMMREDQARRDSRGAPPAEPSLAAEEKAPPTLIVYRDGHQVEVQNYAILGKTLWIFSDARTRQVPLADLDLAATQRVNGDRGVDFVASNPQ